MDWLNLHTSDLDSAEFIGSTPVERATWICLQRYCIGQENGGRIAEASSWKNRKWQQLCRVTKKEVAVECALWKWEGADLVVWHYPKEKENEVRKNREHGKLGGRPKLKAEANQPDNQVVFGNETTRFDLAETEGKGREEERNTPVVPKGTQKGVLQLRAEQLMRRRPETPYTAAEARAFKKSAAAIKATTEDDWRALESFYAAPQQQTFARKDLAALVNNWNGEIDRAKAWCEKHAPGGQAPPAPLKLAEPIGWRAFVDTELPQCPYGQGQPLHGVAWDKIPAEHQAYIVGEMRKHGL